jgi:hypothetical protein
MRGVLQGGVTHHDTVSSSACALAQGVNENAPVEEPMRETHCPFCSSHCSMATALRTHHATSNLHMMGPTVPRCCESLLKIWDWAHHIP